MFLTMQDSWGDADPSGKPLIQSVFSWLEWDQTNQHPLRKKELWVGFSCDKNEELPMGGGSSCYQPVAKESDWSILDVTDWSPSKVVFLFFFFKGPLPNRFHIQSALWIKRREIQEWEALLQAALEKQVERPKITNYYELKTMAAAKRLGLMLQQWQFYLYMGDIFTLKAAQRRLFLLGNIFSQLALQLHS